MRVKVHVQFLGILEESFESSDIMNTELKLLADWWRTNKLSLRGSTIKVVLFRPTSKLNLAISDIKVINCFLILAKSIKYFAVKIEKTHSWSNKIETL